MTHRNVFELTDEQLLVLLLFVAASVATLEGNVIGALFTFEGVSRFPSEAAKVRDILVAAATPATERMKETNL